MNIQGIELTDDHIGCDVIYKPSYKDINNWEFGKIKSFNDHYVFVKFNDDETGRGYACSTRNLVFDSI